jgi:hypothetical protein
MLGAVKPHKEGKNGEAAHFEHKEQNPGCSKGFFFDGDQRKHKKQLK